MLNQILTEFPVEEIRIDIQQTNERPRVVQPDFLRVFLCLICMISHLSMWAGIGVAVGVSTIAGIIMIFGSLFLYAVIHWPTWVEISRFCF
jgi:hypothetical protein